jgi:LysM repeat protein
MTSRRKVAALVIAMVCLLSTAVMVPLKRSDGYSYTYTVQAGDTLITIGSKFDVQWQSIASANNIQYPYLIVVGESLAIPLQSSSVDYTVASGDSLYSIGLSFEVSWQSIASANGISPPYTISVGETLTIPLYSATTSTSSISTTFSTSISTSYTTSTVLTTSTSVVTQTSTVTTYTASSDPLATGNSFYDQYDSMVLGAATEYSLDPMVLKSQIALESYFNSTAVSPDDPCGALYQDGVDVGHSYGLLQMTPACMSWFARNPDDTVDLASNPFSLQWGNSAFNPQYNIYSSALLWYQNLQYAYQEFPGCTQQEYVYMGLAAYNAGWGSVYSCTSYSQQGTHYIQSVMSWYQTFSEMSGWTDPY